MRPLTISLCRDPAGWFASMSGTHVEIPPELVRWSKTFANRDHAWVALDVAHAIAQQLTRQEGPPV